MQVKIWFQNRRARERRGKDNVTSTAQPLSVTAGGGGGGGGVVVSDVDDHRHRHIKGLLATPTGDDDADGCCRTISPFNLDDAGRGILMPESLLCRQPFQPPDAAAAAGSRRYVVPSTSSVAAMMRATLDYCRQPSWTMGFPRHHLTPPSLPISATSDLLAHLTTRQPLSTAFSLPPLNLLRF